MARYVPYNYISPIYSALSDIGSSTQEGLTKLGEGEFKNAELGLKSAEIAHKQTFEDLALPGARKQAMEANTWMNTQKELDQPLNTKEAMGYIFGPNPSNSSLKHFFENDIQGDMMKVGKLTYDQENDQYKKQNGDPLTRREFMQFQPIIHGAIIAKTDPVKKMQDALTNAKAKGDVKAIAELTKIMNNPNKTEMFNAYDQQEQHLLDYKGTLHRYGFDTSSVDDSMKRIDRKRSEMLAMIKLDKELAAKGETRKPEITQKDIAELYMKAHELVDKRMKEQAEQGMFQGWDQPKIDAYRGQQAASYVADALRTAGVTTANNPGKAQITASDILRGNAPGGVPQDPKQKGFFDRFMDSIGGQPKPGSDTKPPRLTKEQEKEITRSELLPESIDIGKTFSERLKQSREKAKANAEALAAESKAKDEAARSEPGTLAKDTAGWFQKLVESTRKSSAEARAKAEAERKKYEKPSKPLPWRVQDSPQ